MEAIAIKTEPPEVVVTSQSGVTSAAVAETTKQPTQNLEIEKSRCGEIFVTNNARKWTFTCTYCDKTTRDIGEFICHIQYKHMNGQYNEDGGADNENEVQPITLRNNATETNNNSEPNILFQTLTHPTLNDPHTQTFPITPTIATVSSLANSNNAPTFEYSDSTNESDDFINKSAQNSQHLNSIKITNTQSLHRAKRKHEGPKYERVTSDQLKYYVIFCSRNPEINTNQVGTKSKLWEQLATALNALKGPTRTPKKWRESLTHWKTQLRSRSRLEKAKRQGLKGVESPTHEENAFDQYAANVLSGFEMPMPDHITPTYQYPALDIGQDSFQEDIKPFAENQTLVGNNFDPSLFLHQELCTQEQSSSSSKSFHKVREKIQDF